MASDRDAVSRRMQPGEWDPEGFLGSDESLSARIAADLDACRILGTDPTTIGRRLLDLLHETARHATESDDPEPVAVGDVEVTVRPMPAPVSCPWAIERDEVCLHGPGGAPSADEFTIARDDRTLDGLTLSGHLIAEHEFFGGVGSRYRIDPIEAYAVLLAEPVADLTDELIDQLAEDLAIERIDDLLDDRPDDSR